MDNGVKNRKRLASPQVTSPQEEREHHSQQSSVGSEILEPPAVSPAPSAALSFFNTPLSPIPSPQREVRLVVPEELYSLLAAILEELKIKNLLHRVESQKIAEVIIATNPSVEGDATALYLSRQLRPFNIRITRLAHGMPVGGELDYADSATLLSALEYRREV